IYSSPATSLTVPSVAQRQAEVIPALIRALKDPDAMVREAAETSLKSFGPDAVAGLIDALRSKDESPRPGPTPARDKLRPTTSAVLTKLGSNSPEAIATLTRALDVHDVELRRLAAWSLASLAQHVRPPTPLHAPAGALALPEVADR